MILAEIFPLVRNGGSLGIVVDPSGTIYWGTADGKPVFHALREGEYLESDKLGGWIFNTTPS